MREYLRSSCAERLTILQTLILRERLVAFLGGSVVLQKVRFKNKLYCSIKCHEDPHQYMKRRYHHCQYQLILKDHLFYRQ